MYEFFLTVLKSYSVKSIVIYFDSYKIYDPHCDCMDVTRKNNVSGKQFGSFLKRIFLVLVLIYAELSLYNGYFF